jgi:hemoglobin/transferrin/lactoferrin receptor protein
MFSKVHAALLVMAAFPLFAADQETTTSTTTDAEVPPAAVASYFAETTVTATGSERDVFEVATPVTVMRREEIQRKEPENAADLLREQPGVDVNGVGVNQARPIIRGQRGLRVLFLENGLRMNNPRRQTDFGEITGLVDLESVDTIEVVRGPASVLYGSDAIGGVLNMISRTPAFAAGTHFNGFADLRHSTMGDLSRGSVGVDGTWRKFTMQLGATMRSADDYEAPAGRFGNINLSDDTIVRDTGVEDNSIWGSLAWALTERDLFRFRFNNYRADQTGFGFIPPSAYGESEDFQIRILYPEQNFDRYTLQYFGSPLDSFWADSTNVQAYFQSNERELVNDIDINIGPIGPGFPDSEVTADTFNYSDLDTWGFRADAVKALGPDARHILTYGIEGYRDDSYNTDFSRTVTTLRFPGNRQQVIASEDSVANAPNASNTNFGVFAQDEIMAGPRLRLTAGVRYHDVATRAEPTPDWDTTGLDFEDRNVVGSLTTTYQLTETLNILASVGTAFRAPNIIERLFNGPTPEGAGFQLLNPALSSETSQNIDIGLKYRRAEAFMEAVFFRNNIRDGIIQDFLSLDEIAALPQETRDQIDDSGADFVVRQENADRLRYQGFEIALGYRAPFGLTVGGNYTSIDADRIDSLNPPTGDTYSSKVYAYARFEPAGKRYWAEYHVRHNGSADVSLDTDQPPPPVGLILPSFTVHGAGAGAHLFEFAGLRNDLTVWIENLTDELYAEFSNATFFRPEPGRTAKISYRIAF